MQLVSFRVAEAVSQCSPEDQATLAALLDTLHFTKVYRFPVPNVQQVTEVVESARQRFLRASHQERIQVILSEISHRLSLPAGTADEEVSKQLLWRSARRYGLEKELPPLTLAREVLMRGMAEVLKSFLDAYEKADATKRRQIQQQMEEVLKRSPSHLVEELRKFASVETLTSEAIIGLMRQIVAGGGTLLFLNSLGFSAYIALSTIIHTLFTTVLGVTLPFAAYTTASTVLSTLTGPVGWAILGLILAGMLTLQGNRLNNELLHMVTLTALMQWYHTLYTAQEEEPVKALTLAQTEEKLPAVLQQQSEELRSLKDNLQTMQREAACLKQHIENSLHRVHQQEQHTASAVRTANERHLRVRSLQQLLEMANQRRESLQQEMSRTPGNDLLLFKRYQIAEQEVRRLEQETQVAMQLAEEAERKRLEAEQRHQRILEQAQGEIAELRQQLERIETENHILVQRLKMLKEKRKQEFQQRFARLLPYIRLHERALEWFGEQTDENVLLAAEKALLDMNYSVYPQSGWRRISGTEFEEIRFTKDYRIYFLVNGNIKYVMTIGHKNSQLQDIDWLRRQRNPLGAFAT